MAVVVALVNLELPATVQQPVERGTTVPTGLEVEASTRVVVKIVKVWTPCLLVTVFWKVVSADRQMIIVVDCLGGLVEERVLAIELLEGVVILEVVVMERRTQGVGVVPLFPVQQLWWLPVMVNTMVQQV